MKLLSSGPPEFHISSYLSSFCFNWQYVLTNGSKLQHFSFIKPGLSFYDINIAFDSCLDWAVFPLLKCVIVRWMWFSLITTFVRANQSSATADIAFDCAMAHLWLNRTNMTILVSFYGHTRWRCSSQCGIYPRRLAGTFIGSAPARQELWPGSRVAIIDLHTHMIWLKAVADNVN